MSEELVFYTHPMSRGRTVRWMLEEIGQPYRTEVLEHGTTMKAPAYLAVNPMGKVPALRHGDVVVTETAAICAYLADVFPAAGLAPPPGSAARGAYYRWLFFAAGPLDAAASNKALGVVVPDDKQGMVGYGSLEAVTDAMEAAVSNNDFIAGPAFTAADVYVGSNIGWMMQFGLFEKRPAFEAYWARIKDRPAAIRARRIDDGLLAGRQAASTAAQ